MLIFVGFTNFSSWDKWRTSDIKKNEVLMKYYFEAV